MQVFWHRSDFRIADNRGLAAAAESGPAVPLFVLDDDVLAYASPNRVDFLIGALAELRDAYRDRGSDHLVRRGDLATVVPDVAEAFDADRGGEAR